MTIWNWITSVLGAVVLFVFLFFTVKSCDTNKDVDKLGNKITKVEKKVDEGFSALRKALKEPKKDKAATADPDPDPKPVAAASDPAPRRTTRSSTSSSGSSDHEKRITNLETWRKNRVDPALDRWDEAAKKLEALGVKGVD